LGAQQFHLGGGDLGLVLLTIAKAQDDRASLHLIPFLHQKLSDLTAGCGGQVGVMARHNTALGAYEGALDLRGGNRRWRAGWANANRTASCQQESAEDQQEAWACDMGAKFPSFRHSVHFFIRSPAVELRAYQLQI
jgi:hypothetical protein